MKYADEELNQESFEFNASNSDARMTFSPAKSTG